jgi:hypothetical protein
MRAFDDVFHCSQQGSGARYILRASGGDAAAARTRAQRMTAPQREFAGKHGARLRAGEEERARAHQQALRHIGQGGEPTVGRAGRAPLIRAGAQAPARRPDSGAGER